MHDDEKLPIREALDMTDPAQIKCVGFLRRAGYYYAEDVAALDDDTLRSLWGIGPKAFAIIREYIPSVWRICPTCEGAGQVRR